MFESREQLKQLVAYAGEVYSKNEISGAAYSKLISLMTLLYLERKIEERFEAKFEAKFDVWTDKFSESMERYLDWRRRFE